MSNNVSIKPVQSPNEETEQFITNTPEAAPSFPQPRPSLEEEQEDSVDWAGNADVLDKFLSAKPRDVEPETESVYIKSLDTNITIRELSAREAEDAFDMYRELAGGKKTRNSKGAVEINAYLVSKALVNPDLTNPIAVQKLQARYGEGLSLPEIMMKIFKPGELIVLGDRIMSLSGTEEDAITEAKN